MRNHLMPKPHKLLDHDPSNASHLIRRNTQTHTNDPSSSKYQHL